ncbi:hypothetical protein, partial [Pseudomonas syringae group genomosp. 7]|uniref:hypothetical protein n=1 Tax=Pseudomonas syringae group genomosp. 7 TaxID=251699 RepID=UPI00376FBB19
IFKQCLFLAFDVSGFLPEILGGVGGECVFFDGVFVVGWVGGVGFCVVVVCVFGFGDLFCGVWGWGCGVWFGGWFLWVVWVWLCGFAVCWLVGCVFWGCVCGVVRCFGCVWCGGWVVW